MAKQTKAAAKPKRPKRKGKEKPEPAAAPARPNGDAQAGKPGPAAAAPPPAPAGPPAVRVRMYRQGLGDCFLLTFPRPGGGDFHVLIDCGVILGTPDADVLMKAVIDDVAATAKQIDVLVATHEHWDHVSGFDPDKKWFDPIPVRQVWLAWTEDPSDTTANRLRHERAQKLAALWIGVGQMRQRLAAGDDPEARDTLGRAAQVLSFFGIDPDQPPPPEGGFLGAAAAAVSKTAAAMRWVRDRTPDPKFWRPGESIPLPEAGGVRAYVLGPPTDRARLFKDLPTGSGRETYDEPRHPALAARSYFAAAFPPDHRGNMPEEFDASLPFDHKYQIGLGRAAAIDFFRDHYLGSGPDDPDAWRRLQGEWMAGAAEFALQLDSDTNNTSLALAFELPDGRVLLFPGDAQVGNWESWHVSDDGSPRVWKVGDKEITAESLLRRTALYKVGHHGSHNATLREKGLEMMADPDLTALVPVDAYIAREKKHWKRMPFDPLMTRLAQKTQGRVVQVDRPLPNGNGAARVTESDKKITVEGPGKKPVERPLYFDYTLPRR